MGTVTSLARREAVTVSDALEAYVLTLAGAESAGTRRTYSVPLRALVAEFGADEDVDSIDGKRLAAWFTSRWGQRSPSTWNVALDAIRSATPYWRDQGWLADDPTVLL